ncbi:MAG: hypothetical protein ABIH99_05110 [Candidatus Micrarchaeota archaeon]
MAAAPTKERNEKAKKPQIVTEARVDGFRLTAKRLKSVNEVITTLSSITFLEMVPEGDTLVLLNVESRDIQKSPYLFSLVYLKPEKIEINYTVIPGMSPSKRRIDVLKYFLNLLTLLSPVYEINNTELYQLFEASVSNLTEYVTSSYDEIYAGYDSLKNEVSLLQKKVAELTASNDSFSKENMELKARSDELTLRVKELETYSDDVLMLKVQEWLVDHKGEMNIGEFARVNKVSEIRVEQVLNKMVIEGWIEAK